MFLDPRQPSEGFASYQYVLELKGKALAGFSSCVGLHSCDSQRPASEFCQKSYANEDMLVLESGSTDSLFIWEWYSRMLGGKPQKQPLTIVQKNDTGKEIRWQLSNAWPTKWDGHALAIDDHVIAINELGISHMGAKQE